MRSAICERVLTSDRANCRHARDSISRKFCEFGALVSNGKTWWGQCLDKRIESAFVGVKKYSASDKEVRESLPFQHK